MAKNTSLFGKVSGKLGAVVFSTSGGQTISREYNPNVANPNTQAQVNQRARMKLMSQLSAVLSPVIAMTKEGLVSKRNKFVKRNFGASYVLDGFAQITYENVQITEGNTPLPALVASGAVYAADQWQINVGLSQDPSVSIKRIAYALFRKTTESKLEFVDSAVETTKGLGGSTGFYPHIFRPLPNAEYVVFAYGMSDTSERATAEYGNLNVLTASDIAQLIATRAISFSDYQFTQTRAITIASDGTAIEPETEGRVRVYVTALGNAGTVSGGGSFTPGSEVTVQATPNEGYLFQRWLYNGTELTASTQNPYTFTVNEQTDLVAVFALNEHDGL